MGPFGMADAKESEGNHIDLSVDTALGLELDVIDLDVVSDDKEIVDPA